MNQRRARRRTSGFTLMEVLLVLVILAMLAGLAVNVYSGSKRKADINTAKAMVGFVKTALQQYQLDVGSYPSTVQGLQALQFAPSDLVNPAKWSGPYLANDARLADPWDQPYQYACPGTHNPDGFDFWSYGPDMLSGTDDDIGNWN